MNETIKQQLARCAPLIIILTISGLLSFWVRDFVSEVIVRPMLWIYWYTGLIVRSIPDTFFWAFFLVVGVIIALRSLRRDSQRQRQSRYQELVLGGSVSAWARQVSNASDGGYFQRQLAQSLCRLTWRVLQDEHRNSMSRIEEGLRTHTLDLPPDIQAYFETSFLPAQPMSKMKQRLGMQSSNVALGLDPAQVVTYLEAKLDPLSEERLSANNPPGEHL